MQQHVGMPVYYANANVNPGGNHVVGGGGGGVPEEPKGYFEFLPMEYFPVVQGQGQGQQGSVEREILREKGSSGGEKEEGGISGVGRRWWWKMRTMKKMKKR